MRFIHKTNAEERLMHVVFSQALVKRFLTKIISDIALMKAVFLFGNTKAMCIVWAILQNNRNSYAAPDKAGLAVDENHYCPNFTNLTGDHFYLIAFALRIMKVTATRNSCNS